MGVGGARAAGGRGHYYIVPGLRQQDGDGFFRPQPNPDAQPAPVANADVESVVPESAASAKGDKADAPKETQYDFYTLLPGKEVQMSDAELAASAREEEARKTREAQRAAALLNGQTPPAGTAPTATSTAVASADPKPLDETPAAATRPPATATAAAASAGDNATASAKPSQTVASADGARYILQAGAFAASGDAEATKAKIALLGLGARVESAQINGKTVYRVRMGPYGTASELAEAKGKLASGGLPAMAIKAK